ncbi:GNAT family N-acetyltransferase [Fuscovulum ytuae]|uniref:GNAT family N-acetyltransferase n=1 Tax=Fuscovulum ytuae TaxID=3042299 RepID=A0ABY8Q7L0_9RHOB|nr:GNAT family N-acetyltransferase [Fuscovulum sp. YMD61]WGV16526.1 GNAT family N-acetyltransferase [Fuscovulum sp. YMD61]
MFTLRPALPDDATFLATLERRLMELHARALWGQFRPAEISAFDLSNTRIVMVDGAMAGYLMLERAEDHLRLRKLYLDPGFQGRGIGGALLALARDEARLAGLPLRLSVLRPNARAQAFYLRAGMALRETTAERVFLEYPPETAALRRAG